MNARFYVSLSLPEPLSSVCTLRSINHLSQDFKSMLNYDFLIAALFYLSLSSTNKGAPKYGSLRRRKPTVEGAAAASYSIPLTLVLGTYTNFCSKQGMLHSSAFNVGQEASKGENEVGECHCSMLLFTMEQYSFLSRISIHNSYYLCPSIYV